MLACGSVLAYSASRQPSLAPFVLGIGAVAGVALVLVLWRGAYALLPWTAVLLGLAYTVTLVVHRRGVDGGAPLVAVGIFLGAELAAWSLDERDAIASERAVWRARATALGALTAAGLAASALVVALSLAPGSGLAWTALGAAASVLVVALAVRLARHPA